MGKLIIIDKGNEINLEFEEVLVMYKPLIKNIIYSFNNLRMEYDDKYQVATIALWNAYKKYDSTTTISFVMLAKKAILNELMHEITYNNRKKRSGIEVVCADRIMTYDNGVELSILDSLEADVNIEENMILKSCFTNFINKITQKQKETISLCMSGKKHREISKILGISMSTICMRMDAAKKTFKKSMAN